MNCMEMSSDDATSSGEFKSTAGSYSNVAIAHRLEQHRSEIIKSINPSIIFQYMYKEYEEEELEEMGLNYINMNDESRKYNAQEALLKAVESKPHALTQFARYVEEDGEHLGHSYIAKLLLGHGKEFSASMRDDMTTSARYKKQCRKGIDTIIRNLNVDDLTPLLYKNGLLTSDEFDRLVNSPAMTRQDKAFFVIGLLQTKGPMAHLLFVQCLAEQKSDNPTHEELLQLFGITKSSCLSKRKAVEQTTRNTTSKLLRYIPRQTKAQGILISQTYLEAVENIHGLQYVGNCKAAIIKVEEYKSAGKVELYVALMCRNWYAYVNCCKSSENIHEMVEDAMKSLQTVKNDNRAILESRCEWMLSKFYWYMNDKQKAQYHIDQSMLIQTVNQVAPGEDTLLTHYGKACTLLDRLAEQWCPRIAKDARRLIQNANDFAVSGDYGLYLSHHCIRLAQISLRSSPQCPGVCSDSSDLEEAAYTLDSVDVDSLSPRTKCLFYITYSDYHRNKSNHQGALDCVEKARSIAQNSGFNTELKSIEKRFDALKVKE